ncbi:DoxX family protein [Pseudopedobacter saltans DSM 12145]|uniref:DoxX family protein n=1 Tax=Pseudopedobacter saltans (strain ATCC 51119 / DSM 12145 / JCM 21818 / CCUG 39354 / LMG 10337 / NBRC 100064 / NCIMB 13643) TaxID=762903 RepID=F0S798_PSESL|nr:DoxX family protein [Pseudopedobacter saltans]ADY54371.1 DoxX family protein [Pseudopedobacter saltans DSM 12145]
MINKPLSYILLRLAIAMSMLGHGIVRIPKLDTFAEEMVKQFEQSVLPPQLVLPFGYILPYVELLVGVFMLVGLFTKQAIVVGAITMIVLIFGSSMIEAWGAIPSQLIHILCFVLLLSYQQYDNYSLDKSFRR